MKHVLGMTLLALAAYALAPSTAKASPAAEPGPPSAATLSPASAPDLPSAAALAMKHWVLADADAGGRPFAIVDKLAARLLVFHADGRQAGASTVLLGRTVGDHEPAGVGERTQLGQLRDGDSTTPAGRFETAPGKNLQGEVVVWLDYRSAFAIHRVRPGPAGPDRLRRMASSSAADKRISAGCVVVPVAFFESVVRPLLGLQPSVVYVLPEDGEWQRMVAHANP